MSKILEKNGIENTSLDAARFNRFCANYRDGIIKGSFKECKMILVSSNVIQIEKGEILIDGFRLVLSETTLTFSAFPTNPTRYQIIAQIQLDDNKQPQESVFVQQVSTLKQDNLFSEIVNNPIYQVEIGRYSLENNQVADLIQTLDIISANENNNVDFNIGDVSTEKINPSLPAEVDIDERFDNNGKRYIDFKFNLPIDLNGVKLPNPNALTIKQGGVAKGTYDGSSAVEFDLDDGGGAEVAEPWTVLYDKESEDAALNWGLANGITGSFGKLENLPDLSEYNTIRFRFYSVGCHQYYTFDISGQGLNYCRWSVPNLIGTTYVACSIEVRSEETKYLHVNSFKSVAFASNKYPTITDLKDNTNHYISKIEVKTTAM